MCRWHLAKILAMLDRQSNVKNYPRNWLDHQRCGIQATALVNRLRH